MAFVAEHRFCLSNKFLIGLFLTARCETTLHQHPRIQFNTSSWQGRLYSEKRHGIAASIKTNLAYTLASNFATRDAKNTALCRHALPWHLRLLRSIASHCASSALHIENLQAASYSVQASSPNRRSQAFLPNSTPHLALQSSMLKYNHKAPTPTPTSCNARMHKSMSAPEHNAQNKAKGLKTTLEHANTNNKKY